MIGSSLTSPACICLCSCSSVSRVFLASAASFCFWSRKLTICFALAVSVTTWKSSPASGSESRPSTSTGVEGSALRIWVPRSLSMARTLPNTAPQMKKSPTAKVPLRTSTVATGERLRHHAVIGGHHQNHDVGNFGAAGAHSRECFVAGRIDEDDLAVLHLHLVCADVLRNSAGLAARHVGFANRVQQRSLAVIHVAHDRDHGRALLQVLGVLGFLHGLHRFLFVADGGRGRAEIARH